MKAPKPDSLARIDPGSNEFRRVMERLSVLVGDRPRQLMERAVRFSDKAALQAEFYGRTYRDQLSLESDTAVTPDATWVKLLALRLTVGVWQVEAAATLAQDGGATVNWYGRLRDAAQSLTFASAQTFSPANASVDAVPLTLSAIVRVHDAVSPLAIDFDVSVDGNSVAQNTAAKAALVGAPSTEAKATYIKAWKMV